jgi:AcrR family transcriptional regulator
MSANGQSSAGRAPSKAASAPRYRRSYPGVPRRTLKRSQRERLMDAMIALSAERGYHAVSITELCSSAGVSPVTFYEHFEGKEACFLAAYRACAEHIFAPMRAAVADCEWSEAPRVALEVLLGGLESEPEAGRLLFIEALGAGPAIREERGRVLAEFERRTEELLDRAPKGASTIDVPLMAVIGALRHVISRYLRTNAEDQLPALLNDGLSWLSCYAVPGVSARWSTSAAALLEQPPQPTPPAEWEPEPLPPGTSGLPAGVIARSQRTRLIYAIAEVSMSKGWANTKIADIVTAARVARPVFYEHFADKEDGFLEAQEHPTQHILDRCAQAYFSADDWPERMWRCLQTLTGLIVESPAISHLRLVECYAAGPKAIRRAEEITRSFTIFLEEGYRYGPEAGSLPRLCSQAVAGAIFEIIQRDVAEGDFAKLTTRLPQLTYIAIAPFTGAREAIGLVEDLPAPQHPDAGS